MEAQEWLYARIHHCDHADGELILRQFVPPWSQQALRAGARKWFFVRYADMTGPHIRLRFHGSPRAMDECYAIARHLWREEAARTPARGEVERLHPRAEEVIPAQGQRRLSFGLYGREHAYYGQPAAVDIAEALFQASSELSLEIVAATGADRARRARLAVQVMRGCLGELGAAQRERFWRLHWQHWTAALGGDLAQLRQAEDIAAQWQPTLTEDAVADADRDESPLAVAAAELGRTLADGVRRALNADPAARASRLLLMQLHMTLNRLGFLPLEEAVLGRVAAQAPPFRHRSDTDPARIPAPRPNPERRSR
ncbi:thiopeptide-type bacteriocin biosynthesis protein [Streptomyces sp. ISL-10]|uniref:thiopeptide-type bacteriocin biosynthesis protein n=1 Tax=Streptomyces sp. ISL-10 TaxID=2819172 RepID=UPI001BEA8A54|nr:thiopeptide-type bacteriocin biosynthesis protein [Streptomyces sp. ISL-10]MBT2365431.1 thiopeptide-type bacteriocin biosynthesis protein [Streptomyces sp. ISL-10]